MDSYTLTFYGGVGSVTGANFLLKSKKENSAVMVDCGLQQGCDFCDEKNRESFAYDPSVVKALFVTHAHIDHIGRIPKLVKEGFRGDIYSTPTTKELAAIMFDDALSIMEYEAKEKDEEKLYERTHAEKALAQWKTIPYYTTSNIEGFTVEFKDAGHILGSAIVELSRNRKIVFTGDLGNSPSLLLRDTDSVTDASYMVMESVYGDRNHEPKTGRREKLRKVVQETVDQNGTVLIPAFSIERTQELLYELNELIEGGKLPKIPVYLDSPLAIKVTEIYRNNSAEFNHSVREDIKGGDKIFHFPNLKMTEHVEESKKINDIEEAKIVIAGSGMSEGGRILHHEKRYLPDPNSTLLIVGYQAPGSRGRKLQEGVQTVQIHDDTIPVRAKVETIFSYSAHKDSDNLLEFAAETADAAEKIFVAMGEPQSSAFLAQRIRDFLGAKAVVPKEGDEFSITL